MLTKQQILEAEELAAEWQGNVSRVLTNAATAATPAPKLAVTTELELAAAQELGVAIQHLERGDHPAARGNINNAINHLNEAELE